MFKSGSKTRDYHSDVTLKPLIPKVISVDPEGSAASSQGIHSYISVMATLKLTYSVKKEGWNFNSGNYLFTTDTK